MLFLTGLNHHLFRLVVHSLSFRSYVFGTTTAVLLDNKAKDWGGVVVVLVELWLNSSKISYFFHSCNGLFRIPSKYCTQDIAVYKNFRKIPKISVWLMPAMRSFDSLLNSLISFVWLQSWEERFLVLVVLELHDQLLELVFRMCIRLFDCWKWYAKIPVVNGVVTSFPVTLRIARCFQRWSWFLAF